MSTSAVKYDVRRNIQVCKYEFVHLVLVLFREYSVL